jgi:DNA-binding Lrp family transcriptional regulator
MLRKGAISVALSVIIFTSVLSVLVAGNAPSIHIVGALSDGRYDPHYTLFISSVSNGSQLRDDAVANQSAKMDILMFIESNPGSHFRLICSSLSLCVGVVQYHVQRLEEEGLVSSRRFGKYRRFYKSGAFDDSAIRLISVLRIGTVRSIVNLLLVEGSVRHVVLADRVGISSQALSWHMKRMREAGLVTSTLNDGGVKYSLNFEKRLVVIHYLDILKF